MGFVRIVFLQKIRRQAGMSFKLRFHHGQSHHKIAGRVFEEKIMNRVKKIVLLFSCILMGGCGVLAAPCRVASAVIKVVPVVGHAAALPTDACAAVIDP
jgi:hypothetical protein